MQNNSDRLLSILRAKKSGYFENATDDVVVEFLKDAKPGDVFLSSELEGPCPRVHVFVSFDLDYEDENVHEAMYLAMEAAHHEDWPGQDVQRPPEEICRTVTNYRRMLLPPDKVDKMESHLDGRWEAMWVHDLKFALQRDGADVLVRGYLLRWPWLKGESTYVWMGSVPIDAEISSDFVEVLGGRTIPVGWQPPSAPLHFVPFPPPPCPTSTLAENISVSQASQGDQDQKNKNNVTEVMQALATVMWFMSVYCINHFLALAFHGQ